MNRRRGIARVLIVGLLLVAALAAGSCDSASGIGVGAGPPARWGGGSGPPVWPGGPA